MENILYIDGAGFLPNHQYRVAYYDGDTTFDHVVTETETADGSGDLSSQHTFNPGNDAAGTWDVIVYGATLDAPADYNSDWSYTIASDTFPVTESDIPEFPTALAAIAVLALCAGIYLWLRRRAVPGAA